MPVLTDHPAPTYGGHCDAPGCDKPQFGRQPWCDMHRTRMRRHGTLERKPRYRVNFGPCLVDGCDTDAKIKGYCDVHYQATYRWGDPHVVKFIRDHEVRFWASVTKTECCWLWSRSPTYDGYGIFGANGKRTGAHRWALMFSGVEIPLRMQVDHLCRNRACVRPDHLEVVTAKENRARNGLPPPCACGDTQEAQP